MNRIVIAAGVAAALLAVGASQVDIYGIADPTNRLEAIRAKWPRAADRVSQWEMPDYDEAFQEIDSFQDWCNEDKASRYGQFEQACRDAIALKIEPAIWYYNLACAFAVQGKPKGEVFDALEQAVAAGYNRPDGARTDSDFQSVTNDVRFAKLCEAMGLVEDDWDTPKTLLDGDAPTVALSEDNVYYVLTRHSYQCYLCSTNDCPIVYLNHHAEHDTVPCDGLIVPQFPEAAVKTMRNAGEANMHFIHVPKDSSVPTIVASNWTQKENRMDGPMSIPAAFALDGSKAIREFFHIASDSIGIYTVASDYACDGIDRFVGHCPISIAHTGGAKESDKFVRLCRDIITALPADLRTCAALYTLYVIRRSQKCVKTEDDYLDGKAWRPALTFSDIDAERAVSCARKLPTDADSSPLSPAIIEAKVDAASDVPCTDLWDAPYDHPHISRSGLNSCFIARGAQRTHRYEIKVREYRNVSGEIVWRVLQGDGKKVRLTPLESDKSRMRIEVDWHDVFDVELPDGRTVKSSRVDIGCFSVWKGRASLPSIVSVYFSPNETREYGADGKLVSIDYTKRQLEGFCPKLCPRGDWKDVFHWDGDGKLTGWTRFCTDAKGRVTTNEFTREGLMIDTRDALGRPKDVHRSMASTWKQALAPSDFTNETVRLAKMDRCGFRYDRIKRHPLETTLAWKYEYKDDADRFGRPSPKDPKPFTYRPELCLRADFAEDSGFRLPLLDQMEFGYHTHVSYRHDAAQWFNRADELMREDSRAALEMKGLKQPEVLKKMKFCPWKPGTNDLWKIEATKNEEILRASLVELADGVYRSRMPRQKGDEDAWKSVGETYWTVNEVMEAEAYKELDKVYSRCKADVVREVMSDRATEEDWAIIQIVESGHLKYSEIPKGKEFTLAMWKIGDDLYFGIHASPRVLRGSRLYFFRKMEEWAERPLTMDFFHEMPSRAIGNVMLGADTGNAEAINNFAVLFYSGIANPGHYEQSAVIKLLKKAGMRGCMTALYNLGVLFENRGEKDKSKIFYDAARDGERQRQSSSGRGFNYDTILPAKKK